MKRISLKWIRGKSPALCIGHCDTHQTYKTCLLSTDEHAFHLTSIELVFSSVSLQLSRSVTSDSLRPRESLHARPPCPSPTPRVYSNPCPSSRWCHPTISSSVVPFSSCPQSLPASGSFPTNQLFAWGGQSIGVSASDYLLILKRILMINKS